MATHYELLSVSEDATHAEIKAAHRRKALQYHPDRFQPTSAARDDSVGNSGSKNATDLEEDQRIQSFRQIQKAWECLRDEEKRREYDDSLKRIRERQKGTINKANVVKLCDMECELCDVEEDENDIPGSITETSATQKLYSYQCRCGDVIEILEEELNFDGESLWECPSCSLTIHIIQE